MDGADERRRFCDFYLFGSKELKRTCRTTSSIVLGHGGEHSCARGRRRLSVCFAAALTGRLVPRRATALRFLLEWYATRSNRRRRLSPRLRRLDGRGHESLCWQHRLVPIWLPQRQSEPVVSRRDALGWQLRLSRSELSDRRHHLGIHRVVALRKVGQHDGTSSQAASEPPRHLRGRVAVPCGLTLKRSCTALVPKLTRGERLGERQKGMGMDEGLLGRQGGKKLPVKGSYGGAPLGGKHS